MKHVDMGWKKKVINQ